MTGLQVPMPSHWPALSVLPVQLSFAWSQIVPAGGYTQLAPASPVQATIEHSGNFVSPGQFSRQQTLLGAQRPERHSALSPLQGPGQSSQKTQLPWAMSQMKPIAQPPSALHGPLQVFPVQEAFPGHGYGARGKQPPSPSQVLTVSMSFVQAVPHSVPLPV